MFANILFVLAVRESEGGQTGVLTQNHQDTNELTTDIKYTGTRLLKKKKQACSLEDHQEDLRPLLQQGDLQQREQGGDKSSRPHREVLMYQPCMQGGGVAESCGLTPLRCLFDHQQAGHCVPHHPGQVLPSRPRPQEDLNRYKVELSYRTLSVCLRIVASKPHKTRAG